MKNSTISIVALKKHFMQGDTSITVLDDISAEFHQGMTYALTGASGTGKSTLLHILAGLDTPDSGKVLFNGRNMSILSPQQRTHFFSRSLGLVFQQPYLIKELSVLQNVMLKGLINNQSKKECEKKARYLLEKFGLADKALSAPSSLSGGQQQRVAIMRAIFMQPPFLLADEPTGSLDVTTGEGVIDFLLACQKEWGMGIIVSSHDSYVAKRMEHVLRLHDGTMDLAK